MISLKTVKMFLPMFLLIFIFNCYGNDYNDQLGFSTYLGSNNRDWISDICLDEQGNVYVTGSTESSNFPITPGKLKDRFSGTGRDVFIAKFNKTGELLFSTLLGGNNYDTDCQIEIDRNRDIIIAGVTNSTDFPVTDNSYLNALQGGFDIFVTKINAVCDTILFSTYLGGSDEDRHPMLALDDSGNIYIAGPTLSSDFPTTENGYDREYDGMSEYYGDIYICKLDPNGEQLLYSSFIGGEKDETVFGIDVDAGGIVYLTGYTESNEFPFTHQIFGSNYSNILPNTNDAFLLALDCRNPEILFSTIFGGNANEQGQEIYVNEHGDIFISGTTSSDNFPVTRGSFDETYNGGSNSGDIFVSKFNNSGQELIYSTYVGGTADEGRSDLTIDAAGNVLVGGGTSSVDFPFTKNAIDSIYNGGDEAFAYRDAFFFVLNSAGNELLYSTFLGGKGDDNVFRLQVIDQGSVYVGGLTTSSDFPMTSEAYDNRHNGNWDAFLLNLNPTYVTSLMPEQKTKLEKFNLNQNYPNPFNAETKISYSIPTSDFITLKIYDTLGKETSTLVNEFQKANTYSVNFDSINLSSGVYFYRLQVGNDFVETKKMLFLQ